MSYHITLNVEAQRKLGRLLRTVSHDRSYRRLLCISLRANGYPFKDICAILQISHKSATEWVKQYLAGGFEGLLKDHYPQRRPSRLDPYRDALRAYLQAHPQASVREVQAFLLTEHQLTVEASWLNRYLARHLPKGGSSEA
jgi:transposase